MENYSLLMGDSSVDEDGGGVDGEAFGGTSPSRWRAGIETPVPQILASRWRRLWKLMTDRFEMSMMGEMRFFLGFEIKQLREGTFINQAKYLQDILKRFKMTEMKGVATPMVTKCHLALDPNGKEVDQKYLRESLSSPGQTEADLAGVAGRGRRRGGAGLFSVHSRVRFWLDASSLGAALDLLGEIWRLGFFLLLAQLPWSELGTAAEATARLNNFAGSFLLQVQSSSVLSPSLAGRGGEGIWECTAVVVPAMAFRVAAPSLAGHGGEGRWGCGSCSPKPAWKRAVLASAIRHPFSLLPLDGHGGEGRSRGEEVQRAEVRQHWDTLKLDLRRFTSVGVFCYRYLRPERPRRSSAATAPGSIYFPHTLGLWRKICSHSSVTHPADEPSGIVPGFVDGDRSLWLIRFPWSTKPSPSLPHPLLPAKRWRVGRKVVADLLPLVLRWFLSLDSGRPCVLLASPYPLWP
ncbi:hypothetical protein QYE76_010180 [Lolium multiflorum]|uniref:Reverse transcriptase Ty1/copia-type domain-containing protein n=1 Tax=Lolium multiflorum TaxID=4521 RepID=A0AAD8X1M0_LOLMU|nr:hypothetical protein QYE76_010180 [Lolium multiflorum]